MFKLAWAVLYILSECGPYPVFRVETYELCLSLMEIVLEDAKCEDLDGDEL